MALFWIVLAFPALAMAGHIRNGERMKEGRPPVQEPRELAFFVIPAADSSSNERSETGTDRPGGCQDYGFNYYDFAWPACDTGNDEASCLEVPGCYWYTSEDKARCVGCYYRQSCNRNTAHIECNRLGCQEKDWGGEKSCVAFCESRGADKVQCEDEAVCRWDDANNSCYRKCGGDSLISCQADGDCQWFPTGTEGSNKWCFEKCENRSNDKCDNGDGYCHLNQHGQCTLNCHHHSNLGACQADNTCHWNAATNQCADCLEPSGNCNADHCELRSAGKCVTKCSERGQINQNIFAHNDENHANCVQDGYCEYRGGTSCATRCSYRGDTAEACQSDVGCYLGQNRKGTKNRCQSCGSPDACNADYCEVAPDFDGNDVCTTHCHLRDSTNCVNSRSCRWEADHDDFQQCRATCWRRHGDEELCLRSPMCRWKSWSSTCATCFKNSGSECDEGFCEVTGDGSCLRPEA